MVPIIPSIFTTKKSAIERFSPIERDCYLDDEFQLPNLKWDFGYRYSILNCLYEGALQKIMSNCSCLHTSSDFNPKNISLCYGRKLQCALNWMKRFGTSIDFDLTVANDTENNSKKCLQRCELQTETVSATSSTFTNKKNFFLRPEFCYVLQKISIICMKDIQKQIFQSEFQIHNVCEKVLEMNNKFKACNTNDKPNITVINSNPEISNFLFDYASNNLAIVKIFIKDSYYTRYIKSEELTLLSCIADAGGLLSLCLGLSFISIFEIAYYLLNGLFIKFYFARNNQTKRRKIQILQ